MAVFFSGFATKEQVPLQQFGFDIAAANLRDTAIVRPVLVPTSMKLLGYRN